MFKGSLTNCEFTRFQFASDALSKMESNAFNEMKETQKHLEKLQESKINDELKVVMAEHQRVLMEVQEIYGRFLFLLKLIVSPYMKQYCGH